MLGRISKLLLAKGETGSDYRKDSCTTMALLEAMFASGTKAFCKLFSSLKFVDQQQSWWLYYWYTNSRAEEIVIFHSMSGNRYLNISSVSSNPGMKIYGPIAEFFLYVMTLRKTKWRVHLKMDPLLWKRGCFFLKQQNIRMFNSSSSCIPFATILPIITWGLTCSIQKNMYNITIR